MSERIEWLRPKSDVVVFHPNTRRRLKPDGERVRVTSYWLHLIGDGSVIAGSSPDESTSTAPAVSTPTKTAKAAKEPA